MMIMNPMMNVKQADKNQTTREIKQTKAAGNSFEDEQIQGLGRKSVNLIWSIVLNGVSPEHGAGLNLILSK